MKREELRELMKSISYPEGWFYVERASVIMFGLSSTLAPRLNGIHVGFPYVTQFIMERNARRLAEQTARKAADAAKPPAQPDATAAKLADESEALLN
jgi:hypothetical protein